MNTELLTSLGQGVKRVGIAIDRTLSSAMRSWLICCVDYRVISYAVLGALILLLCGVLFFQSNLWLILPTLLILGILSGTVRAASDFSFFLERASQHSLADTPEDQIIVTELQGTGLKQLDDLLNSESKRARSLHEALESLKEENALLLKRYEILTENLAAAVIIREPSGKIAYCSPYAEVLTGYSLAEIYESDNDFFIDIVHEDDRSNYQTAFNYAAIGEGFQARFRFFHKTGMPMWAETRTVPIVSAEGDILSSLSITLDVTSAVRYQEQVEEKNRDLQDFTYMVTHDLKAPIYTLKGMVNLIEEDYQENLPDDLKEPLAHIHTAARRLEELVTSVLEYSRLTSLEFSADAIALGPVCDEVKADYEAQLSECQGTLRVEPPLPQIIGEKTRIYQVFSNLIGNAIKYRSSDRPLTVTIRASGSPTSRYVTLEVEDNGCGIAEDKLERIFRPFQRAHGADIEGSGIGLACVKKIVEKLGGTVEVSSAPEKGSTFRLRLKRAAGEQQH
jgi:PAS domain S-box-containing protein